MCSEQQILEGLSSQEILVNEMLPLSQWDSIASSCNNIETYVCGKERHGKKARETDLLFVLTVVVNLLH